MAHRLLRDPDADGWERADFPIVCESCLGPNPYVRMQRIEFGGECHISGRPYTVFRWRPGNDARYKKTIICQDVAKAKNVCQVCLLDLDYNLPVQVRDSALNQTDEQLPESDVNKEYTLNRMAKDGELDVNYAQEAPNDTILKLQRTAPYYKRNRAQICSFFVRGECKRGAECPYRHEMPLSGDLADQNIKDRYFGTNDPVARKMLNRVENMPSLVPPEDQSITTLYIGGVLPEVTEDDIKDHFYGYGEIKSIRKIESRHCAFVTYSTRQAAEKAAQELSNRLLLRGSRCKLMWGRPQEKRPEATSRQEQASSSGEAASPAFLPPKVQLQMGGTTPFPPSGPNFFALPPTGAGPGPFYPSMDPSAMGTRGPSGGPDHKRDRTDGEGAEDAAKRWRGPGQQTGLLPPMGWPAPGGPPPFYAPPGYYPAPVAAGLGRPGVVMPGGPVPGGPAFLRPPAPQQQQQPAA